MRRRDFFSLALAPLVFAGGARAHEGAHPEPMHREPELQETELQDPYLQEPQRPEPDRRTSRAAQIGMLPNVPLVTHRGEKVRFYDDLVRGKIVLINFFLVECTDGLCPTITANLRKVQDLLGERMGRDVFFYSISLKPRHDTPRVLKEYADNFGIKPGWLFLTGKPADVDRLRRAQGFVDWDPIRDRDLGNHTAMGRYGDDRLDRWGGVALRSSPENIASIFGWLST
jgi:protein SCO1/2